MLKSTVETLTWQVGKNAENTKRTTIQRNHMKSVGADKKDEKTDDSKKRIANNKTSCIQSALFF